MVIHGYMHQRTSVIINIYFNYNYFYISEQGRANYIGGLKSFMRIGIL